MVAPEEATWFVGGTGIQTEGEIEDFYPEDGPYDFIGVIIVGVIMLALIIYVMFII